MFANERRAVPSAAATIMLMHRQLHIQLWYLEMSRDGVSWIRAVPASCTPNGHSQSNWYVERHGGTAFARCHDCCANERRRTFDPSAGGKICIDLI